MCLRKRRRDWGCCVNGYEGLQPGDVLRIGVGFDREVVLRCGVVTIEIVPAEMRMHAAGVVMARIQVRMHERRAQRANRHGHRETDGQQPANH